MDEKGHPLFWGEWKPVSLYLTMFTDFHVTDLNDMTTASGAANIAAFYANIPCNGLCFNLSHLDWLNANLEQVFVAIVADKKNRRWRRCRRERQAVFAACCPKCTAHAP